MIKTDLIKEQYDQLLKQHYGADYYLADLHIHTPGSKLDFKIENNYYEESSLTEVIKFAVKANLINQAIAERLSENPADDLKDTLTAELIIHQSVKQNLSLIVITDHNTLAWYSKIQKAKDDYLARMGLKGLRFEVLPGVELTCYGGNHIIIIFNPKTYKDDWIKLKHSLDFDTDVEGLGNPGTTKSEVDVIKCVKEIGGISYIPHIDNDGPLLKNMLSPLSGKSKAKLLTDPGLMGLGFSNIQNSSMVKNELRNNHIYHRKEPLAFLQDSDAHRIDRIGTKPMHIKMNNPSFNSLKFAFEDPDLRIKIPDEKKDSPPHVIGMAVNGGFLINPYKPQKWVLFRFNKDLNCIIGGKGAGKTTALNCLVFTLKRQTKTVKDKRFLATFGYILVFIEVLSGIYCVVTDPSIYWDSYENKIRDLDCNIEHWIKIYQLFGNRFKPVDRSKHNSILENVFSENIAQAEIIEASRDNEGLNEFFHKMIVTSPFGIEFSRLLTEKAKLERRLYLLARTNRNERFYTKLESLNKEFAAVDSKILALYKKIADEINTELINRIRISVKEELFNDRYRKDLIATIDATVKNKKLKNTCFEYVYDICSKIEPRLFVLMLYRKDFQNIVQLADLKEVEPKSFGDVEGPLFKLNDVLNQLYDSIIRYRNDDFIQITKQCSFTMEVNVKHKQYSQKQGEPKYVNLFSLSGGQKAVALLTLIMEGKTFVGNRTVLIIDQPEDQLDNTFIYEHLIQDLRLLKGIRQVILVTHNPNIPVAGDSEQVFVMESDNEHGWIKHTGSIDDLKTQTQIIINMEGGEKSLQLRLRKYHSGGANI